MAGIKPFFVTGANCKLKINGVTMAYATDLTYTVTVNHAPARVLGLYEADTNEPVSYGISGSFTLIRYIDSMISGGIQATWIGTPPPHPHGASDRGNGIGSFSNSGFFGNSIGNLSNEGSAHQSLDPSKLSQSSTFDIELYQKVPGAELSGSTFGAAMDLLQGRQAGYNTKAEGGGSLGVSRLRDCRITGTTTNLTKRGFMTQTFSFIANYVDEDSFLSSSSGLGQQYT